MTVPQLYTRIVRWLSGKSKRLFRQSPGYAAPILIGLLPDDPQWGEQGLLPMEHAYDPLPVQIPAWNYDNVISFKVTLQVYWDANTLVYEKVWPGADFPTLPPDDLRFDLPVRYLLPGTHVMHYQVTEWTGNVGDSEPRPVTIDLTAPVLAANQGPLKFDTSRITFEYLASHDDSVSAIIESYRGGAPGDAVTWYWSRDPFAFGDDDIVSTRPLVAHEISNSVTLVFTGDMIRARGDGVRYAFYRLTDRAGNASSYSLPVKLDVAAQPVPRVLPPPRIKGASGSASYSTLNPLSATNGAIVTIPANADIRPGDLIAVQWAEPGSTGAYRTDQPEAANPLEFRIPAGRIPQHFGKTLPVYYEVTEPSVEEPHVSNSHALTVSRMSGFPVVQCDKVSGGRLALSSIDEGGRALFTLETWTFMGTDQFVNLEVSALNDDGQQLIVPVLSEYPVPSTGSIMSAGYINKVDLQRFKVGGPVDIIVGVSFDQKLSWQAFPKLTPTLYS
ncbi:hypothetical protein [Pseudomonas avellanae]|nr:hypothetical protein [Pseudomonas avellanae]EKG31575.1 hypothetical protein Pav631_3076 [Pseudomonas avellanae BPIC 631]UQW69621.1 hypothetical protein L2Y00_03525 [Pseudomonas avellanae]UQW72642.1 hypothetical protein L2Y01_17695 [Pseudomonas avellanae]GGJ28517.1 hypothetical protein GCM10009085_23360 [Pseudomonas avellanae]